MDSFVIIKPQKKSQKISLHDNEINLLKKYINEGKNVFLCGSSGFGKTFILKQVLDELNSIEIWDEPLRKKDIFMSTIKKANMHAYIEDYESDIHAYKCIVEQVSEGIKITNKQLIVTSKSVYFMDNFVTIIIQKRQPSDIIKLKPKHTNCKVAAEKCLGNLHNFYDYLEYPHQKDFFKTPKEIVSEILCNNLDVDVDDAICEHGHIWAVIQENYPDAIEDNAEKIADSLSSTDVYDDLLYQGYWEMMPYFSLNVMKIPRAYFTKELIKDNLRPGRFWTKFGNQKMREQKIKSIRARSPSILGHQEFMILREYAKKGDVSKFKEYNLTPQDFDVMNHLGLQNKLKQREVTKIKKLIKEEITK